MRRRGQRSAGGRPRSGRVLAADAAAHAARDDRTGADLLGWALVGQGSSKAALVELRRYSNRDDLLKPLVSVLKRISEEPPVTEEEAQLVSADGPTPRAWHVRDRLTSADIKGLVTSYRAGDTIRVLAEQYSISTSSVKRLLREHGARKQRPRSIA